MATGDNTRSVWDPFLYELRGKVWEVFPTEAPFLAELSGVGDSTRVGRFTRDMDTNREVFSGRQVRHTLILAQLAGGGFPSEAGTWNAPHALSSIETHIKLIRAMQPFSVTVDVERDSLDNSSASSVAQLVREARIALARNENLAFLGDGSGLIVDITDSATSLTTTCGTTWNPDVLLPGTVWDVLTRSSGADPGQGLRRKIASVNETTRVITWDTAAQATDGGSGNIVHASTEGIYIPGSYTSTVGTQAPAGLELALAASGTFQDVNKATYTQWQGTDGRGGDTTTKAASLSMLDGAVRRGRRSGLGTWDFGIGDPAAIDLYKQQVYAQLHYMPDNVKLKSGYQGVVYDGADRPFPLIKDPAAKKAGLRLIDKESFQLYGDKKGPDFLDDDGGMFRRFSRTFAKEADLLDRVQLGVIKCNTIVYLNNLDVAA